MRLSRLLSRMIGARRGWRPKCFHDGRVMTPFERITKNHRLGFIGLGHLGSPMARRLLSAGFPISVYNRDSNKTEAFSTLGAEVARDLSELAREVDVVLSCVADGEAVEA